LEDSPSAGPVLYSDHVVGHGAEFFAKAEEHHLEGIVSKKANAAYRSTRTKSWLKVKTGHGQEFVVIGWDDSPVKGKPFASLLLAVREGDRFVYRGRIGSGFSERDQEELWPKLKSRARKTAPAEEIPDAIAKKAHFVKPELVVEVAFRGWSADGLVRQGSYKGLRSDKPATEIVAEVPDPDGDASDRSPREGEPVSPAKSERGRRKGTGPHPNASRSAGRVRPPRKREVEDEDDPPDDPPAKRRTAILDIDDDKDGTAIEIAGVKVTNPGRVMFPGRNITKRVLIDYQLAMADFILPHVADRPLSLVRCPRGQEGDCFFQKHATKGFPTEFKGIEITEKEGRDTYLYIEDEKGLVAAVQMGALELHIWGAHNKTLEKPDRLVFDFDPDVDIDFAWVKLAAEEMRDRLKSLDVESFCMATGGKGLHVVVPLKPKHGWDDIKAFAEAMARMMAADDPDRYLAVMSKAKRKGRIFIDYLRNGRGATAIAPFSTRARAGAPLAWPVSWRSLKQLESAHPVTIETYADALKQLRRSDPWKGYFDVEQVLPLEKLRGG
jgi:bifunctional non-homologous end joining protein LigD